MLIKTACLVIDQIKHTVIYSKALILALLDKSTSQLKPPDKGIRTVLCFLTRFLILKIHVNFVDTYNLFLLELFIKLFFWLLFFYLSILICIMLYSCIVVLIVWLNTNVVLEVIFLELKVLFLDILVQISKLSKIEKLV